MDRPIENELFEALMRASRTVKHRAFACGRHHGPGGCGHHGPHGPEGFGHRGPHGRAPLSRERVLTALLSAEDGLRQKALAEQLKVNPSSMSEFIDRLESDGYIIRTVDPADKRATLITLTEKGQARTCEVEDERAEFVAPLFASLTEDEKAQLLALLGKIIRAGQAEREGQPE